MKDNIDVLKKLEELTAKMNQMFSDRGKNVFARYPLTFAILILFGVTMVTAGVKEILLEIDFFKNSPYVMILVGILVLAIAGTLYEKLKK